MTEVQISDLVINEFYEFTHARKGVFRAVFLDWTSDGDSQDTAAPYLLVRVHTEVGYGYERLAHGAWYDPETGDKHAAPPFTELNLRADLVTKITTVDAE